MIIVLFWLLVGASNHVTGAVGTAWWKSAAGVGQAVSGANDGSLWGLGVAGLFLFALVSSLSEGWRWRRLVGAGAVTLAMVEFAALGGAAWLSCVTLLVLAGAAAWGPRAYGDTVLILAGLVLGGFVEVKNLLVTTLVSTNHGVQVLERSVALLVFLGLFAAVLVGVWARCGALGRGWLRERFEARFGRYQRVTSGPPEPI